MPNQKQSIHSPFRYPGGKFYARKLILAHLPEHKSYCEPFCGGASIFFSKPKVGQNRLNDLDDELINCLKYIKDNVEDLISGLPHEASKDLHNHYKNHFKPKDDLERAIRWFYLNRISYSGIMKMQNCYWGYGEKYSMPPKRWPIALRNASNKLQDVELSNLDFSDVFLELSNDYFLFVDPPYFNADQDKFYSQCFQKEDHYRLRDELKKLSDKGFSFLITYDNTIEVREMYEWCDIVGKEWTYTINRTDDQKNKKALIDGHKGSRKAGREIFITNYRT